ncbi:MAG TPA: cytochrome c [Gemmatimonadota bacterium]|nr:cytochrome c [Gemmatimonadota bacterium]
MRPRSRAALRACAAALLALSVGGCEWFMTMSDPPDIQPHEREPWPPPALSIPLDGDPAFDLVNVDQVGLTNPQPADSASLARGRAVYDDFCSVCHGPGGGGDGSISGIFPAIPPIGTAAVADRSDAYLYALITQGRGLMPEYSRIPKEARWDIVNLVRSLPRAEPAAPGAAAAAPADTTGGGS